MPKYTPDQLLRAFNQVQGHVRELHVRWRLFRNLYRGNADLVPVFAQVGGEMFVVFERLLHRGSLLLFRQLTDPAVTKGKRNASFEGLLEALAGPNYKVDQQGLMGLIGALRSKKAIRDHANKYIAHLDFDLLAGIASPPDSIALLDFEDALRIMRRFITEAGQRFVPLRAHLDFESDADLMTEQAENLIETLRQGLGSDPD